MTGEVTYRLDPLETDLAANEGDHLLRERYGPLITAP